MDLMRMIRPVHLSAGHIQGDAAGNPNPVVTRSSTPLPSRLDRWILSVSVPLTAQYILFFTPPAPGGVTAATVIVTAAEQLCRVSASPATVATHAP